MAGWPICALKIANLSRLVAYRVHSDLVLFRIWIRYNFVQTGVSFSDEGCVFTRLNFSGKKQRQQFGSDSWLQPLPLPLATLTSQAPANRFTSAQPNFIRSIYLSIALGIGVCLMPIFVSCPNKSLASEQQNNENCCLFSARIYDPMSTARTALALHCNSIPLLYSFPFTFRFFELNVIKTLVF